MNIKVLTYNYQLAKAKMKNKIEYSEIIALGR